LSGVCHRLLQDAAIFAAVEKGHDLVITRSLPDRAFKL
jgi:hypothetical protein